MLLIQIYITLLLLLIFVQDMLSRLVYWWLFPVLAISFIILRLTAHQAISDIFETGLINCCFLILQLVLVSVWFSFKSGKLINIMSQLLGWGDVLFLVSLCFYLSVLNFLFFYITSLVGILILWIFYQNLAVKKSKHIPLAGCQAILFMLFLLTDQWIKHFDLTKDEWLLQFMMR